MTNSQFLKNKPLELSLPAKESIMLRSILKDVNEDFVLNYKEKLGVKVGFNQYYDFEIHCPKTNFANAYFHFGLLYCQKVLPIWQNRFKKVEKRKKKLVKWKKMRNKLTKL